MAQRAQSIEAEQAASADIIAIATSNPIVVLTDEQQFDAFYAKMKAETDALQADVSTKSGRDKIAAMAYKVSQTKTTLYNAALGLTEGWRKQTKTVNEARAKIVERLDGLRDEVRAPLTAWEATDKARVAGCQAMITRLSQAAVVQLADTAAGIRERIAEIEAVEIDEETYQELADQAVALKEAALATLEIAVGRLEQEEKDRAELEQLRAAQAEREARETENRRLRNWADTIIQHCRDCENGIIGGQSQPFGILIHELEKKVTATAEEFGDFAADVETARVKALARVKEVMARDQEERRAAAEKADAERIANVERAAAEQAQRDAAAASQAELDRIEAERAEERAQAARELAASQARIAEAERQAQAERDAAAARETERANQERVAAAERERLADEQATRDRDQEHRTKVSDAIQEAMIKLGVGKTAARTVVLAIAAGSIPHVSIKF